MDDTANPPPRKGKSAPRQQQAATAKEQRLAEALRANLRRRKAAAKTEKND